MKKKRIWLIVVGTILLTGISFGFYVKYQLDQFNSSWFNGVDFPSFKIETPEQD